MALEYIEKYRDEIKNSIEDLKHKDTFYRQIPNLLTFLRLALGIPAGLMYFINPYVSFALIAFLWGTDAIDGKIARKFKIQSKLGADMDTVADKIMFLASALPLLGNNLLLIINFILEGVISSINVIGRMNGLNTKTVLSGKIKTVSLVLTLVAGYVSQFFGMPVVLFNSLIPITTVFQFIAIKDYIFEYVRMENELKQEDNNLRNEERLEQNKKIYEENTLDRTLAADISQIDELKEMKKFILASLEDGRVYTGKKRTRVKLQQKKNINNFG